MEIENALSEMENLFLALADKTRLRLLNLMRNDEVCVGDFTEVLGESQPKISRHLSYLRNAGVVSARRDGKRINYKIVFPENICAAEILENTLLWLKTQAALRREYAKLMEVRGVEEVFAKFPDAPTSNTFAQSDMNFHHTDPREELPVFLL
ncbi:MAG: metalloregulator ArsR/SmtB family transcription factor [Acidobacteriota bacterium]|nr:metalloregulator ArsR/SmtB family transcription factor [Acidobacteriota bacterium]